MALDVGEKRIGVALSDPTGTLASPLTALERKGEASDLGGVLALVREHRVEHVVVGLPLTLRGELGPQGQKTLAFINKLAQAAPVPVTTWDERFSTRAAERLLAQGGAKGAARRARQDAAAAAFLLQGYLDALRIKEEEKGREEE